MRIYEPLGWTLFKSEYPETGEVLYEIFGTRDRTDRLSSWRMSSGSPDLNAELNGNYVVLKQCSGSAYKVPLVGYGWHTKSGSEILKAIVDKARKEDPKKHKVSLIRLKMDGDGFVVYPLEVESEEALN